MMTSSGKLFLSSILASIIAELKYIFAANSKEDLFRLQKDFQALNLNDSNFLQVKIQANIRALQISRSFISQSGRVLHFYL